MRCLEKDRNRRYETANALALDIERFLHDDPVAACPPSAGYRLRKFLRRNRAPVLAACLVLLTLIGGLIGTPIGMVRAERARQQEERRAGSEAEAKTRAEEQAAITAAVNEFLQYDILLQASSYEQARQGYEPDPNLTIEKALDRAAARVGKRFQGRPK